MTPSKEAIEAAKELFDRHYMQWPVIYTQALEAAYAIDFVALQQENERLARTITDFQDVICIQERQIFALHSEKKRLCDLVRELAEALKQWSVGFGNICNESTVLDYERERTLKEKTQAALARAEEVLK